MSSTDTSLTIVNSMTEEYLESLKDGSGKIPSMANQLIMTNDEVDVSNIDIENVTTIYDMSSTDASLNWGLTSGILGNVTAYRDLTAYEKLIFVPRVYNITSTNTGGWSGNYVLDLTTKKPDDNWYIAGYTSAYSDSVAVGEVNKETWNFLFFYNPTDKELKWRVTFNGNNWNNNANCYITKIYGVKKKNLGIISGSDRNLVADIALSSTASSIEITGLDINSDGGVYDFIVEGHNSTQQESSVYIRFNNLSNSRYFSCYIANNDTYVYGNQQLSVDQSSIGQFSQNECYIKGTITLSGGNPLFSSTNWYLQNAVGIILRNGGYYDPVSNITSIRFNNTTTFAVGTKIKIYKRSTNNARVTS